MRDQKVWSLPTFERLHIGGWGMKNYKQHCYMFQLTRKIKKIIAWPPLASKTTLRIQVKLQRTNSCPILNERVCKVIPHLWLSWQSTCMFWSMFHTWSDGLTWGEGQASPYILFLSRSVYSLTKQVWNGRALPFIPTKSWSTAPA